MFLVEPWRHLGKHPAFDAAVLRRAPCRPIGHDPLPQEWALEGPPHPEAADQEEPITLPLAEVRHLNAAEEVHQAHMSARHRGEPPTEELTAEPHVFRMDEGDLERRGEATYHLLWTVRIGLGGRHGVPLVAGSLVPAVANCLTGTGIPCLITLGNTP